MGQSVNRAPATLGTAGIVGTVEAVVRKAGDPERVAGRVVEPADEARVPVTEISDEDYRSFFMPCEDLEEEGKGGKSAA